MEGSFRNFQGMSGMAKSTSDSTLGVIRKDSCILDHFKIFVNIALNMLGGGLRSPSAFLVIFCSSKIMHVILPSF